MRLNKMNVLQTAAELADKNGLNNVSLKSVAETLGIKTPSLYNHVENLDDLLRQVAHMGMKEMNDRMYQAAIGSIGENAIKKVGIEYLSYMIEHPGIYETIQWATWHGTEETGKIFSSYEELIGKLILSCDIQAKYIDEVTNLITGFLHGYTTLQLRYAFSNPEKVKQQISDGLGVVLKGIFMTYRQEPEIK